MLASFTAARAAHAGVDLSSQFRKEISIQTEGDYACHVYAVTALLEARCFRKIGKHIDISEAAILYGHYSSDIENKKNEPLDYTLGLIPNQVPYFARENVRFLGELRDGGSAVQDINLALSGWACEENRFAHLVDLERVSRYWKFMWQIVNLTNFDPSLDPSSKLKSFFDRMVQKEFNVIQEAASTVGLQRASPELDRCISDIRPESVTFDSKLAKKLLDDGIPFICSAAADFYEYEESGAQEIVFDSTSSGHAAVVIGYDPADAKKNEPFRWKVRDSVLGQIVPARGDCQTMTFIR